MAFLLPSFRGAGFHKLLTIAILNWWEILDSNQ